MSEDLNRSWEVLAEPIQTVCIVYVLFHHIYIYIYIQSFDSSIFYDLSQLAAYIIHIIS
jgi:hypothetical protein